MTLTRNKQQQGHFGMSPDEDGFDPNNFTNVSHDIPLHNVTIIPSYSNFVTPYLSDVTC